MTADRQEGLASSAESLPDDPLEAAREFTRLCKEKEARAAVAFGRGEDWLTASARIDYEPTDKRRFRLLDNFYAGTATGKLRQLIHNPYGWYLYDRSYEVWPSDLGIDIDNDNPGAFTPEGAQAMERINLLFWLTLPRGRDEYYYFARQAREYEELFGEPYYEAKGTDDEVTKHAMAAAPDFLENIKQQVANFTPEMVQEIVSREEQTLKVMREWASS